MWRGVAACSGAASNFAENKFKGLCALQRTAFHRAQHCLVCLQASNVLNIGPFNSLCFWLIYSFYFFVYLALCLRPFFLSLILFISLVRSLFFFSLLLSRHLIFCLSFLLLFVSCFPSFSLFSRFDFLSFLRYFTFFLIFFLSLSLSLLLLISFLFVSSIPLLSSFVSFISSFNFLLFVICFLFQERRQIVYPIN